jgi:energy-coupling factor transport system permease protein
MSSVRVPRALHPGAWWLWAGGLATAASRTTNPLLLGLVIAVAGYVVAARRPATPWSSSYAVFLRLGLLAVALRVGLFALLGDQPGGHVLVRLPQVPLPHWLAGLRLGGPISVEGLLAAAYDGLRLATVLVCIGAANALTSPARLLKSLPGALYELGVTVAVALSFAPQAVVSLRRVHAARRLRGRSDRGVAALRGLAVPVLEGALERSVELAAAMDARGFGRRAQVPARRRRVTALLTVGGLLAVVAASYGLLDPGAPAMLGLPLLVAGGAVTAAGFVLGARAGGRTRYRPDPWRVPEWAVAATGCVAASGVVVAGVVGVALDPSTSPPQLPGLPLLPLAGVLMAILPAWLAPPLPAPRAVGAAAAPMPTREVVGAAS